MHNSDSLSVQFCTFQQCEGDRGRRYDGNRMIVEAKVEIVLKVEKATYYIGFQPIQEDIL